MRHKVSSRVYGSAGLDFEPSTSVKPAALVSEGENLVSAVSLFMRKGLKPGAPGVGLDAQIAVIPPSKRVRRSEGWVELRGPVGVGVESDFPPRGVAAWTHASLPPATPPPPPPPAPPSTVQEQIG